MATWLGAQEAHYASILWHLEVAANHASQVDETRSVFPGKALVNVPATSATHASVKLIGKADAWITDMERATSMRPKMYGFDYARVSETYLEGGDVATARTIIENQADRFGELFNEILTSPLSNGKNLWLRLLHEPNIRYFWWGEPERSITAEDRTRYHTNFKKFWVSLVNRIKAKVTGDPQDRLKFVFCINGEASKDTFQQELDRYIPTETGPHLEEVIDFINSTDVLGLDYYEDWNKQAANTNLKDHYQKLTEKVQRVSTVHGKEWAHALT